MNFYELVKSFYEAPTEAALTIVGEQISASILEVSFEDLQMVNSLILGILEQLNNPDVLDLSKGITVAPAWIDMCLFLLRNFFQREQFLTWLQSSAGNAQYICNIFKNVCLSFL